MTTPIYYKHYAAMVELVDEFENIKYDLLQHGLDTLSIKTAFLQFVHDKYGIEPQFFNSSDRMTGNFTVTNENKFLIFQLKYGIPIHSYHNFLIQYKKYHYD